MALYSKCTRALTSGCGWHIATVATAKFSEYSQAKKSEKYAHGVPLAPLARHEISLNVDEEKGAGFLPRGALNLPAARGLRTEHFDPLLLALGKLPLEYSLTLECVLLQDMCKRRSGLCLTVLNSQVREHVLVRTHSN